MAVNMNSELKPWTARRLIGGLAALSIVASACSSSPSSSPSPSSSSPSSGSNASGPTCPAQEVRLGNSEDNSNLLNPADLSVIAIDGSDTPESLAALLAGSEVGSRVLLKFSGAQNPKITESSEQLAAHLDNVVNFVEIALASTDSEILIAPLWQGFEWFQTNDLNAFDHYNGTWRRVSDRLVSIPDIGRATVLVDPISWGTLIEDGQQSEGSFTYNDAIETAIDVVSNSGLAASVLVSGRGLTDEGRLVVGEFNDRFPDAIFEVGQPIGDGETGPDETVSLEAVINEIETVRIYSYTRPGVYHPVAQDALTTVECFPDAAPTFDDPPEPFDFGFEVLSEITPEQFERMAALANKDVPTITVNGEPGIGFNVGVSIDGLGFLSHPETSHDDIRASARAWGANFIRLNINCTNAGWDLGIDRSVEVISDLVADYQAEGFAVALECHDLTGQLDNPAPESVERVERAKPIIDNQFWPMIIESLREAELLNELLFANPLNEPINSKDPSVVLAYMAEYAGLMDSLGVEQSQVILDLGGYGQGADIFLDPSFVNFANENPDLSFGWHNYGATPTDVAIDALNSAADNNIKIAITEIGVPFVVDRTTTPTFDEGRIGAAQTMALLCSGVNVTVQPWGLTNSTGGPNASFGFGVEWNTEAPTPQESTSAGGVIARSVFAGQSSEICQALRAR